MDPQTLSEYAAQIRFLANGGNGSGGTATCTLAAAGSVRSFTIHTPGSGYSEGDVLTCNGATFTVTEVNGTGGVTAATILTGGSAIVDATNLATTVAPAGGTGCKLNLVAQFPINSVTITAPGTGYITALAVLSGGDGTGGEITFDVAAGALDDKTIVSPGNYRTAPTIQVVAGPPADGAAFIASLSTFDDTYRYARLLDALGDAEKTVVISSRARAAIEAMRTTLLAG